jgi:hypothetical protein
VFEMKRAAALIEVGRRGVLVLALLGLVACGGGSERVEETSPGEDGVADVAADLLTDLGAGDAEVGGADLHPPELPELTDVAEPPAPDALPEASDLALDGPDDLETEGSADSLEDATIQDLPEVLDDLGEVDLAEPDVDVDDAPGDASGDVAPVSCEDDPGSFGCPCQEPVDCDSGWCVPHMGAWICTTPCDLGCEPGWTCTQMGFGDVLFVCLSSFPHLCLPCEDSGDCRSLDADGDACVRRDPLEGGF